MAISFDAKKNFAITVVATAPSPAASGTSLVVAGGFGTILPAVPFNAVIWPTGVQPTNSNAEIVRVTNISTDTLTITRAQESTAARTIIVGDQIAVATTAKSFTDIETAFVTASALTAPIGGGMLWFTDTAPTGWLLLRGQAISRATYATLFALWGTTWGAGDGSTTFNVPNLQSRIPIGKGLSGTLATLAATAGQWDHVHSGTTLSIPNHTHGPGTLTVASHDHGPGTLQVESHMHGSGTLAAAGHTHFVEGTTENDGSHGHTGTAESAGSEHFHLYDTDTLFGVGEGGFDPAAGQDGVTDTDGAHEHTVNIPSGGAHSHEVDIETSSQSASVSGSTGGYAPFVTAGLTGSRSPAVNAGATGETPSVTAITGSTGAGNPPVLVVNFIVRATNEV